jgi:membrane associated rhomboid family serine protease
MLTQLFASGDGASLRGGLHWAADGVLYQWLALDHVGISLGQYWRFFTAPLLHHDPLHLLANMVMLYFAGREVEPIVGPRHFLGIYLGGTLLGNAVQWLAMPADPVVGVTAGVAAVIVAFTTILPELEIIVHLFFVLPLRLRAKYLAFALAGLSAVCWLTLTAPWLAPAGILAASLFAWVYVKQLGFGNPLAIQRYIFERRQRAARLERMNPDQFITSEIDPILEKISQHGLRSLTRAERKILEQGREKMTNRDGRK